VENAFKGVILVQRSASFVDVDARDAILPYSLFTDLRDQLKHETWRLHYVRQWYGWCANFGYPNFSIDVAFEADQLRIGGNRKGHAVLSADPEEGPLSDLELAALLTNLRAAKGTDRLSLGQQAALWLCVALGPNPMQMALLTEDDVVRHLDGDAIAFVHLRVPRMKKRDLEVRGSFRTRQLNQEISEVLLALIEHDRDNALMDGLAQLRSRPIFKRNTPRGDLVGGPLDRYSWHLSAGEFSNLVQEAVAALSVLSPRTGQPLRVTTRRLRYTFATRLVREGVGKLEVADLLDHTDTQNVQVYFDIKSDIVEHLDKAVALALAPLAQAFMGALVSGPEHAIRGDDPRSSVAVVGGSPTKLEGLGNCGSYGYCGLLAPIACYTCRSFQPWIDAPHHLVLDELLSERERREKAGLDGRMVSMMDNTICAVAEVITRIDAHKGVAI
jgi:integrase